MKKVLLLSYFLCFCIRTVQAQVCATTGQLPSDLENTVEVSHAPASGSCSFQIRVFFHIVRQSNGTGGQNASILGTVQNNLNSVFNPQGISFSYIGSDEINNDAFYNLTTNDDNTFNNLTSTNFVPTAVNVYLLDDSRLNAGRAIIGGRALAIGGEYSLNGVTQLLVPSLTVAHEMGHCLGLYHTFETTFGNELVNGSNCIVAGDRVCDTPAESPAYSFQENNACAYGFNLQDANGDNYNPIVRNVMNYVRPSCFQGFTGGQGERMRRTIGISNSLGSTIIVTPVYAGGTYSYGGVTYGVQNASTGISVSNSSPSIYIALPNYGPSTSFSWSVNSQNGSVNYSASNRSATITLGGGASFNITCTVSNECGSTPITFNCYNYSGGFRMAAYPNPANQDLTIAAVKDENAKGMDETSMAADQPVNEADLLDIDLNVKLTSKENKIVRNGKLSKGKIHFSVADLPNGTYYLQLHYDQKKIDKQIIIQH